MTSTKRKINQFLSKLTWSVIIWILASFIFGLIRVWGVESLQPFERVIPFNPFQFSIQIIVLGMAIGLPFGIMDYMLDNKWLRHSSYWKIMFIKSIVQLLIAVFSLSALVFVSPYVGNFRIGLFSFIFSETSLLWIIYTGIISLFIYFLQVVKSIVGRRVLINLMLGRYHNPRQETRIFMFLDMKDSTTHAENLGHIKFSSLIQDSFNDLTSSILQHNVEVYQYVGDEAILTWELPDGFENANCLKAYYTFQQALEKKKDFYEKEYGFIPFFKAGVHLGDVTVSEVGAVKRDIAYHSDVLNTAARIQGKCNEFKAALLISEVVKENLENQQFFNFEQIGGISLKGKQQLVNIYSVSLL